MLMQSQYKYVLINIYNKKSFSHFSLFFHCFSCAFKFSIIASAAEIVGGFTCDMSGIFCNIILIRRLLLTQ